MVDMGVYVSSHLKEELAWASLAWPDRFFPFFFGVAEKRVWSGLQSLLVLAPPLWWGVLMAVT